MKWRIWWIRIIWGLVLLAAIVNRVLGVFGRPHVDLGYWGAFVIGILVTVFGFSFMFRPESHDARLLREMSTGALLVVAIWFAMMALGATKPADLLPILAGAVAFALYFSPPIFLLPKSKTG